MITDYASLQADVLKWLHRENDTALAAMMPALINAAEGELNADLFSRGMETTYNLTTVAGTEYYALPSDIIDFRRVALLTSPRVTLKYATPDEITNDFATAATGKPVVFAVVANQIQLAPIPDSAYTVAIVYRQKIPALSASNTTNWLLTAYPNAYLFGTLLQCAPYIVGDPRIPVWQEKYGKTVAGINNIDWYTGSTMRVRAA